MAAWSPVAAPSKPEGAILDVLVQSKREQACRGELMRKL